MNFLSLDSEFSSFYSDDRAKSGDLLQISIIPVIDGIKQMDNVFNEFVKPIGKVWNTHAEKVHKISRRRADSFQEQSECAKKLKAWLEQFDCRFTVMAFNHAGDKKYMNRFIHDNEISIDWYSRVQTDWCDVYKMAMSRKDQIPKKKLNLGSLCEYFGVEIDAHDGLSDASATVDVYNFLKQLRAPNRGQQEVLDAQLTELEKRKKFMDIKYVQFNGNGDIFLTEYTTKNKEALKVILAEIWDLYVEKE